MHWCIRFCIVLYCLHPSHHHVYHGTGGRREATILRCTSPPQEWRISWHQHLQKTYTHGSIPTVLLPPPQTCEGRRSLLLLPQSTISCSRSECDNRGTTLQGEEWVPSLVCEKSQPAPYCSRANWGAQSNPSCGGIEWGCETGMQTIQHQDGLPISTSLHRPLMRVKD